MRVSIWVFMCACFVFVFFFFHLVTFADYTLGTQFTSVLNRQVNDRVSGSSVGGRGFDNEPRQTEEI